LFCPQTIFSLATARNHQYLSRQPPISRIKKITRQANTNKTKTDSPKHEIKDKQTNENRRWDDDT
jgi:hypothetical protein